MRIDGRRYRDEWIPNFYPSTKINDRYVRLSRTGRAILLTSEEDSQINEFFMDSDLFDRLERTGHIVTAANSSKVFEELATWLKGTYDGPGLHIVVPTRRCNLNCTYCHMYPQPVSSAPIDTDLQPETVPHIARFILSSPRSSIAVEFQGGEPFLNFPAIVQMVEEVNRLNVIAGKTIKFGIVSNLMVVNDEQLAYCRDHKIGISYSLNGPQQMHDLFRIARNGTGSHASVVRKMEHIKEHFPGLLASYPLFVITEDNMDSMCSMAEYYFNLGFKELGLIHLKNLGNARGQVGFDMRKFIPHYFNLLDYLYEKNRAASSTTAYYTERTVHLALRKILGSTNPLFVDWRNPIGYFSNCVIYDTDGQILPVDEARSMRDVFGLGNVRDTTYDELIRSRSTFKTINLSIRDRDEVCRECTFNPYCGVSPVLHYAKTGHLAPEAHVSEECTLVLAVFDWVFKKMSAPDPIPLLKMAPTFMSGYLEKLAQNDLQPADCPS